MDQDLTRYLGDHLAGGERDLCEGQVAVLGGDLGALETAADT